jgi:hypothetical protein
MCVCVCFLFLHECRLGYVVSNVEMKGNHDGDLVRMWEEAFVVHSNTRGRQPFYGDGRLEKFKIYGDTILIYQRMRIEITRLRIYLYFMFSHQDIFQNTVLAHSISQ